MPTLLRIYINLHLSYSISYLVVSICDKTSHVYAITGVQWKVIGIIQGIISFTTVPLPSLCMILISPRHIILSLCRIFARAM